MKGKAMTKKDYKIIAKIIAMTGAEIDADTRGQINALLRERNPRYDREKFWSAVEKLREK